jgi:hypothetical protein
MIDVSNSLVHWNYFLALEEDLARVSRFIEFSESNFSTYSLELAHLLLASSSEVDVVAKQICQLLDSSKPATNIDQYRSIITSGIPDFAETVVIIPRFKLTLRPWSNWTSTNNPDWWGAYNRVKHQRHDHFMDANLKHAINSTAALLVSVFHFYKLKLSIENNKSLHNKEVTKALQLESTFLKFPGEYYMHYLLIG